MRISSTYFNDQLISSSQQSQQQLAALQTQISTGQTVQEASDNPGLYSQATQEQTALAQLNTYTTATTEASTLTTQNNSAMTSLHTLIAQASELATSVNGTMSTSQVQDVGTEVSALVTQITSLVNQQSADGTYLFGGTSNAAPLTSTGAYNSATNGDETSIDVQPGSSVTTGIAAGRSGTPPVNGFLYNSTTGVDVMATLNQTVTDLNNGDSDAVESTDIPALDKALDLVSSYVGSTAASMSAVQTASNSLSSQTTATSEQLNALTQTNLPNATLQLQQIQTQYQASLEAGSRILNLSILNYLGSVSSS